MSGFAAKVTLLVITGVALSLGGAIARRGPMMASQPEEHDYTIEIQSVVIGEVSRDLFHEDSFLRASMNNDMKMMLHANLTILKELPADGNQMLLMIASMKDARTNVWVEKFRFNYEYCDFIENNTYLANNMYKDTNFPRKCPITPGEYYINGVTFDSSEFPKHMEESEWRGDARIFDGTTNRTLIAFSVYANLETIDE